MEERRQLEQAIAAQESLRGTLDDSIIDATIAALREKLAALEPAPVAEQQRKLITVLFADISGFTAMSESRDAEDVTEVVNALWARLDRTIIEHNGRIDKHMGDGVMALWGVETAREDDPEQAIRAALAMQSELGALRTQGVALSMRVGVNTGSVLLGEVGTAGEYTAMGDTVNVASRLEGAAPLGGVLISHATYRHVCGVFDVQALEPIQVKGKAKPLQVYLVGGAKPRAFRMGRRGVEGIETRMVGRDAELKWLQEAFHAMLEDYETRMVTVVGEAGVGKSRLLYEYENWLELLPEGVRYFKGRAREGAQGIPYSLLRDLFAFRFQIQEDDPIRVVREKMEAGVSEALGAGERSQMKAHFIGGLLGFDFGDSPYLGAALGDPQQVRDRGLMYLVDYFRAVAEVSPTVVFLEDLHWADDSSLDAVDWLARGVSDRRLLVVGLARHGLYERRPRWGEGRARLDLHPLSRQDCRVLVVEILQKVADLPEALRELLVGNAEGNPYYVEELVKMLIEDGVIVKGDPHWMVRPERLAEIRVPPTLTGVLQARLDSLPRGERAMLQQASVVGRVFWDEVISHVNLASEETLDEQGVQDSLTVLRGREMVFRRGTSAFSGTREYIFKHAVLREVTYESVLKRVRRAYHALVAAWLILYGGEREGEFLGLIADHLERAGKAGEAVAYLRRAGERAAAGYANAEAVAYFSRALALVPESDPITRYDLLLAQERVYDLQGARKLQAANLAALVSLVEELEDVGKQAEVALRRANYADTTGDYPAADAAAQEAVALAREMGNQELEAEGFLGWGRAFGQRGDYDAAQDCLEKALELARAAGFPKLAADSFRGLGIVAFMHGDYPGARSHWQRALAIYRQIGDRRDESATLNNLGVVAYSQEDYTSARDHYERTLLIAREIGDRRGEGAHLGNLGLNYSALGQMVRAIECHEGALVISREIGDRRSESADLGNLGVAYRSLGQMERAIEYHEIALDIAREIGNRNSEVNQMGNLGVVYRALGQVEQAIDYHEHALAIAREIGDPYGEGNNLTALGDAMLELGELETAAEAYQQAVALRRELGQQAMAMEPQAGLVRVALAQGSLAQARDYMDEILAFLDEGNTLDGTDAPFRIYHTCIRVLQAVQDPRAREILETAHRLLQERAAEIPNEATRSSFLGNIPWHREIVEIYRSALGES